MAEFIILHIEIQGSPFVIANFYSPNDEAGQVEVLKRLVMAIDQLEIKDNTKFIL